ncbi:ABC transporter ATP-binding protein [Oryzibacter oryziterrae]|uniref:ABC transporter ATP-binding protein n=1 Tax=Oryzibacter oryziterrae TaxID=2766474 RepID=UPI001F489709|nr:ABC transporter ATP-binding protein [Oryzibacter oryziterrae]
MANDALLELSGVTKVFPSGTLGLDAISLSVREGEFVSLLGPSGCGKTTTLRIVAGFEAPSDGAVRLEGRDILGLRPYDRPVNTVFQDYALFPHMNVRDNVAFGLSVRGVARGDQTRRVSEALEMVGLADKVDRPVRALSGGQRQRVALARAIVCAPRVLLLDEPLSALDASLREQMQVELKRLQRELGTTFIMVTHDQTEALSISDRIVVMNHGRIDQVASPAELYDRPATRFVAGFIGTMNLVDFQCRASDRQGLHLAAGALLLDLPTDSGLSLQPGASIMVGIRPEDLRLDTVESAGADRAEVESVVFHGRSMRLHLRSAAGVALMADVPRGAGHPNHGVGATVFVGLRPGAAYCLLPT